MRAKDLKGYILILVFLLFCFLGLSVLYQFGVDTLISDNAINQSKSYYESSLSLIDAGISEYNVKFINGDSTVVEVSTLDTTIFGEKNYAISLDTDAEGNGEGKGYVYFQNGGNYGKVLLQTIMESVLDSKTDAIIIVGSDGKIYGSNVAYHKVNTILEVMADSNSSAIATKVSNSVKAGEVYADVAKLQLKDGVASGYVVTGSYNGLGLVRFVNSSHIVESNDVTSLRLIYYAGLAALLVGLIVTIVLMVKKVVKSGGIDAGISLRGSNIVLICKADGKIIKYNKAFRLAFPNHSVEIASLADLKVCDTDDNVSLLIKEQKKFRLCFEARFDDDGNKISDNVYFEFYSLKRSSDYAIVGKEITEEYEHEKLLIQTSTKSEVTGDDNAVVFAKRYMEVKDKYKKVNDPYTLIMVNLRGFKDVNTLLGFEQGNDVLCFFSEMLHKVFEGLEVFHIQGDEFVLLDEKGDEAKDLLMADKFLDQVKAPLQINTNEIMLRPAFGIVGSDMDGVTDSDSEAVIAKMIVATNKAKVSAGKTVCKYDVNLENSAMKDREMEEDLKQAISRGEFVMFYQPQYEINQERVSGFEALLRWNNPKYASISPEVYIKMAEKNGYIIDVGNFINADVFKTAKEMEQYDIHISVNVSPAQIVQAGFVADFLDKFEKNGLKPGAIALEVTETFLMENFNAVIEKLTILKNRGISIHLDDFGTGYSSMLYLKELPIDTIKVDKEFIKHIETDKFSQVLTSKIITLAKELGDKVICEGVETKVQKDIVGKFGADIIQGYYIGKALSKEDAFALLKTGKVSTANKSNGRSSEE